MERKRLQERFAQRLREQDELEQEEQDAMRRRENRQEQIRQRHERRDQVRQEDETALESEGDVELLQKRPAPPANREPAATKSKGQQVWSSPLFISASLLLQVPTPLAQNSNVIRITFKVWERGVWRTAQSPLVNCSDPSEIERIAVKYMRKTEQIRLYDTDLNILTPPMCFQAAIANGSNMLLLIPGREIDINEELEASVSQLLSEVNLQKEGGSK